MKKFLVFTIFVLIALLSNNTAISQTYLNELSGTYPFTQNIIKVWVEQPEYTVIVSDSLNEWRKAAGGCINFRLVSKESIADIKVYYRNTVINNGEKLNGLCTSYRYKGKRTRLAIAQIALLNVNTNKPRSRDALFSTTTHELGHALGLSGHSSDRNDIMYNYTNMIYGIYPSAKDYNTIRALYCK